MESSKYQKSKQTLQTVFVLEDNEFDQQVIREGIKEVDSSIDIKISDRVGEALTWLVLSDLNASGQEENPDRPDLMFVDLTLPGIYNGDFLVKEAQKDPSYRNVPQIVLSSSKDQTKIKECYRNGAASYIVKPFEPQEFKEVISNTVHYWQNVRERKT